MVPDRRKLGRGALGIVLVVGGGAASCWCSPINVQFQPVSLQSVSAQEFGHDGNRMTRFIASSRRRSQRAARNKFGAGSGLIALAAAAAGGAAVAAVDAEEVTPAQQFFIEEKRLAAKEALLSAISTLGRGFLAREVDQQEVTSLLQALSKFSPVEEPTARLGGEWTLLYTDAPDILGIPTGPLSSLKRIGQEIDAVAGTITNVIEYEPSATAAQLAGLIGGQVSEDMVVQRVITGYTPASATEVELKIRGLSFTPTKVFGVEIPEFARFKAEGPLSLPFGFFEILYMDDDLRIVQTRQGWYSINERR